MNIKYIIFNILVYLFNYLCSCKGHGIHRELSEGDKCVTNENVVGTCIQFRHCISAATWLTTGIRPLEACSSQWQNPIVCCTENTLVHSHSHGYHHTNGHEIYPSSHSTYDNTHGEYYNAALNPNYGTSYGSHYGHGHGSYQHPVYRPPPGSNQGTVFRSNQEISGPNQGTFSSFNQETFPSTNQEKTTGLNQETLPSLNQGTLPGSNQGTLPGSNQGTLPGSNQGILPDSNQGALPDSNQGTLPGSNQETTPEPNQEITGPNQETLPGPNQDISGTNQGALPDSNQRALPDSNQGTLPGSNQRTSPGSNQEITGPNQDISGTNQGTLPDSNQGALPGPNPTRIGANGTSQSIIGPPIIYGPQSERLTGAFAQSSTDANTGRRAQEKCQEYLDMLPFPTDVGGNGGQRNPAVGSLTLPNTRTSKNLRSIRQTTENSVQQDEVENFTLSTIIGTGGFRVAVVGGRDARKTEFPHMALLGYGPTFESAEWVCGGSVISERFILTAGHCISTTRSRVSFVAVGILRRSDPQNQWQRYTVNRIIPHPEYRFPSQYNDIALIETTENITFSESVLPACLNPGNANDTRAYATGWGALGYRVGQADTLQTVFLNKFPDEECLGQFQPRRTLVNGFDPISQMCFGDMEEIKDTCSGDSGGPLQVRSPLSSNAHLIIGVTSFGTACGFLGSAGVYTRVSHYLPWIERVVWGSN